MSEMRAPRSSRTSRVPRIPPAPPPPADRLSVVFAALADPTRRAILARLVAGEASVTELAEPFAMTLPAVSKHLKALERAGLIDRGRNAQWRPCRLRAAPLRDAADWIDHYRKFWEESLDRLDAYLRELQAAAPPATEIKPAPKAATKEKKRVRKK